MANLNQTFQCNGENISDKTDICNRFNKFFTSIGPDLANRIKSYPGESFERYLSRNERPSFKFERVTCSDVRNIIKNLSSKDSSGPDGLSTKLVKTISSKILYPLTVCINQSLFTGIFPDKLKMAKVVPLFKKGSKDDFSHYRPVSLLPSFSKIFERIVYNQLYTHLTNNDILFSSQHGFKRGHSTETAAIEFVEYLKLELDKGHNPLSVFIDLSKAFDTLNHRILLRKLSYYGVNNIEIKWFENYLQNRLQYVHYEDHDSDFLPILTGVPQGSILGPLLFTIYINDINTISDFFKIICFADDTTLSVSLCLRNRKCKYCYDEVKIDANVINIEIDKVFKWM